MTLRWVANSGIDSATGDSMFVPWQTAGKVVASAVTGDRIKFKRGDLWRDSALAPIPTGVTLEDYGVGDLPDIDGYDLVPLTGWVSASPTNTWDQTWTASVASPTSVDVNGVAFPKAVSKAALVPGQFFHTGTTLSICLIGGAADMGAAGFLIEANGNRNAGFNPGGGKGNYLLRNLMFRGWLNSAATFGTPNAPSTLQGVLFRHCGTTTTGGILYLQNNNIAGFQILNCIWDENMADHFHTTDIPSGLMAYCDFRKVWGLVADCAEMATGAGNGSGGWEVHHCYNYIQPGSNTTKGLWAIVGAQTVQSFSMHDCIGDGGGYFASFGGSPVLNNYSFRALLHFNCTAPANVGSFALGCPNDNTQIIDCISINAAKTCVNLFTGVDHTNLQILHCTLWGYGSRGISVGSTSDRMSGLVKNTIAWSPAAISNHVRFQDGVPAQALVSDYNLFGPDLVACIQYNTVNYNSMAAYQTATGQDAHSSTNDPMLADPSTRTPRAGESMDAFIARAMKAADLDPSSWAIGRGVLIPGVNDSFYGPAPDIGAREWQHQVLN